MRFSHAQDIIKLQIRKHMSYKGQNDGKIRQENYTVRVRLCKICDKLSPKPVQEMDHVSL